VHDTRIITDLTQEVNRAIGYSIDVKVAIHAIKITCCGLKLSYICSFRAMEAQWHNFKMEYVLTLILTICLWHSQCNPWSRVLLKQLTISGTLSTEMTPPVESASPISCRLPNSWHVSSISNRLRSIRGKNVNRGF
jgi:hypothetical protein